MVEVEANFGAVNPPLVRLMLNRLLFKTGNFGIPDGAVWECSVPIRAAWENCGIAIIGTDFLATVDTIGGIPIKVRHDVEPNHFALVCDGQILVRAVNLAIPYGY